jgi:hypothetical protein
MTDKSCTHVRCPEVSNSMAATIGLEKHILGMQTLPSCRVVANYDDDKLCQIFISATFALVGLCLLLFLCHYLC